MGRPGTWKVAFALLALAFFLTPIALRAAGFTADAFENRRLADPPRASQGWDVFQQTTRFLTDRLPVREPAVRANNKLWQTFFGTAPRYGAKTAEGALPFAGRPADPDAKEKPPTPEIIEGRDGWLFLKGELERSCKPLVPVRTALARWRELVSIVRGAGKRAVMLVPPDKGSIHGEQLPPGQLTGCARRAKRRFWDLLAGAPPRWGIRQLERALAGTKRRGPVPVYSRADSHWNTYGSLALVRAALDFIGGDVRLEPREVVRQADGRSVGDLTRLRGERSVERMPRYTVRRARGAARVPGRTLFVYDSFGAVPLPQLRRYFHDFESLLWVGPSDARRAEAIARADTVIFESTEREFDFRASEAGPVDSRFLELLRARLASR